MAPKIGDGTAGRAAGGALVATVATASARAAGGALIAAAGGGRAAGIPTMMDEGTIGRTAAAGNGALFATAATVGARAAKGALVTADGGGCATGTPAMGDGTVEIGDRTVGIAPKIGDGTTGRPTGGDARTFGLGGTAAAMDAAPIEGGGGMAIGIPNGDGTKGVMSGERTNGRTTPGGDARAATAAAAAAGADGGRATVTPIVGGCASGGAIGAVKRGVDVRGDGTAGGIMIGEGTAGARVRTAGAGIATGGGAIAIAIGAAGNGEGTAAKRATVAVGEGSARTLLLL